MSDLLIRQTNNARMTSVSASDRSLIQERSQNHGKMWFCSLFTSFTRVFVRMPEVKITQRSPRGLLAKDITEVYPR